MHPHHHPQRLLAPCKLAHSLALGLLLSLLFSSLFSVHNASASSLDLKQCERPADGARDFTILLPSATSAPAANAIWLNAALLQWPAVEASGRFRLYYSAPGRILATVGNKLLGADGYLPLELVKTPLPADLRERFRHVAKGVVLGVAAGDLRRLPELHKLQLVLVQETPGGDVRRASGIQVAGALDDLYASAAEAHDLGVTILDPASGAGTSASQTRFKLWAPTARQVHLCIYSPNRNAAGHSASSVHPMQLDPASGLWSVAQAGNLSGLSYRYLVDVYVPGTGLVRNSVTDPYSISLSADSQTSYIARLDNAALKPPQWDKTSIPNRVKQQTDMVVYELHVRDFSINDTSVRPAWRGKYLAFTETGSHGMQHLSALSRAGVTDLHLLPIFDFATLPETDCSSPEISGTADSTSQQEVVSEGRDRDCYNWGYEPYHFNAPEGSYASDANDGAKRVIEVRSMVQALHRAGLRVGMDMVFNHTAGSGQNRYSVLDRIVPGYYHRLNANGVVETSTCCANSATEHRMMGKLMIDSTVLWTREYQIDSFRFDLMGHQPRSVMETLQQRVNAVHGRHINLLGEGWNFGEVANGARFVQAAQGSLNGSGIGTFSDRSRDAVRGGRPSDAGTDLVNAKGWVNGLVSTEQLLAQTTPVAAQFADMVRVGLAGSLRDFSLQTANGDHKKLSEIDYNGQAAGYVSEPGEVVNYVENHDNQTLFDNHAYKLPLTTSGEERARVQILALATTAFSQGIAYFHAGVDILRSKSMDRDSFNSGDWFNRIDWSYRDNYFGSGMPPKEANGVNYALIKPLLSNPHIKPSPHDIAQTRDMFRDLLRIRSSSTLFRLGDAAAIKQRLHFYNLGAQQNPALVVGKLDGLGYPGAQYKTLLYFINVATTAQEIKLPTEQGQTWVLHPVHLHTQAADSRPAKLARYDSASGSFEIPARTALVYVQALVEQ